MVWLEQLTILDDSKGLKIVKWLFDGMKNAIGKEKSSRAIGNDFGAIRTENLRYPIKYIVNFNLKRIFRGLLSLIILRAIFFLKNSLRKELFVFFIARIKFTFRWTIAKKMPSKSQFDIVGDDVNQHDFEFYVVCQFLRSSIVNSSTNVFENFGSHSIWSG